MLIGLAFVSAIRRTRALSDLAFWFTVIPALGFFAFVSSQTGFNHHVRYILPAVPFLFIATSRLCDPSFKHRRLVRFVVAGLLGWGVFSSLSVYPHSMSHFNEISGGPERGDEHLVDSNIDWGQDLTFLKAWLERHPEARPIGLSYFGRAPAGWLGIKTENVPAVRRRAERRSTDPSAEGPVPGYFAVSVHRMRGETAVQPSRVRTKPIELEPGVGFTYFLYFKPIASGVLDQDLSHHEGPSERGPQAAGAARNSLAWLSVILGRRLLASSLEPIFEPGFRRAGLVDQPFVQIVKVLREVPEDLSLLAVQVRPFGGASVQTSVPNLNNWVVFLSVGTGDIEAKVAAIRGTVGEWDKAGVSSVERLIHFFDRPPFNKFERVIGQDLRKLSHVEVRIR